MVNYHAIGEYVAHCNGTACQVPHYQDNIQVLAYLLGQIPQQAQETHLAFAEAVGAGGPDDFFTLKSVVEKQYGRMNLSELLSFLRLSGWDAEIFVNCLPHLQTLLAQADPVWYSDVYAALNNIWQRYLPLTKTDTLLDNIHQLLRLMGYQDTFA